MIYISTIQWFYLFEKGGTQSGEVKINGKTIEVSAPNTHGYDAVTYRGTEVAPGHYTLKEDGWSAPFKGPHATLHRLNEHSEFLEGYFTCEGEEGMWRIKLGTVKGKK